MSVTERLAGAAERLTELEVPVPDAGRVLRRSRRRRGSVYGVALAAVVLGGIGVVATSRTDQAPVATTVTPTVHAPDAPIGLTRGDAFWPDAQHRPNSAVALGGELAALLGWGDSANIELVCSFLTADTCQPLEGNAPPDGKPTRLRISSPAIGAEVTVDAMAAGTDSGWAFLGIGLEPFEAFPPVRVDGPESASLAYASSPLGTKEVKWWAATHYGELFGAVPAGSPIRIQAPAQSISSVLIVFVDERGNALGAQGLGVTSATGVTCCAFEDLPVQFVYRRAVLTTPRADDIPEIGPADLLDTVERFSASAPVSLSMGRYTDLDDTELTDRLVWVLIEHDVTELPLKSHVIRNVMHIVDAHTGEELVTFDGPAGATCPIEPGATPDRCGNP